MYVPSLPRSVCGLAWELITERREQKLSASATLDAQQTAELTRELLAELNYEPLPSTSTSTPAAAATAPLFSPGVEAHEPESLDWLNVLFAHALASYRILIAREQPSEGGGYDAKGGESGRESGADGADSGEAARASGMGGSSGARAFMERILNRASPSEVEQPSSIISLDRITVSDVQLGSRYPVFSNARARPSDDGSSVRVELDMEYRDDVALSLATRIFFNFPRPLFAVLPAALSLSLERFRGTVQIELPLPGSRSPDAPQSKAGAAAPQPSDTSQRQARPVLNMSLDPDFELELATSSLLGSRAKLQDIPKVEQLVLARIRAWVVDKMVWPGRFELALPATRRHPTSHGSGSAAHGRAQGSRTGDGAETTLGARSDDDDLTTAEHSRRASTVRPPDMVVNPDDGEGATLDIDEDELVDGDASPPYPSAPSSVHAKGLHDTLMPPLSFADGRRLASPLASPGEGPLPGHLPWRPSAPSLVNGSARPGMPRAPASAKADPYGRAGSTAGGGIRRRPSYAPTQ